MEKSIRSILFLLFSSIVGLYISINSSGQFWYFGLVAGISVGILGYIIESLLLRSSVNNLLGGVIGFLVGVIGAFLVLAAGVPISAVNETTLVMRLFLTIFMGYSGLIIGIKTSSDFSFPIVSRIAKEDVQETASNDKILDTSAIIDGRISDLCETGFVEGRFIIPQFILQELQYVADSADTLKRARGRRGLDILNKIQKMVDVIDVRIVDDDFSQIKDVDSKVVALAKKMGAKIITNDLNLNKIAELQGVKVLNINDLCNALKPVVLPGETMKVFVLKEGKEAGQGVAYLDDGTMIVIDDARKLIGKNIDVIVTSVLQTTAGRMIFTRLKEELEREELFLARG